MQCPLCKVEMKIAKTRVVLENDNTPDAETKVFDEMDMVCRNENCSNFDKIVETVRNPIEIG